MAKKKDLNIIKIIIILITGVIIGLVISYFLGFGHSFEEASNVDTPVLSAHEDYLENVKDGKDYVAFSAYLYSSEFARGKIYFSATSTPALAKKTGNGWEIVTDLQNDYLCEKFYSYGLTDKDLTNLKIEKIENGYCH